METFKGYIVMTRYESGSKSDGNVASLFIGPNKIVELYREGILSFADTYFNQFHLKYVEVSGIFHENSSSMKVDSIELAKDPFLSTNEQEDGVKPNEE
jgi:hypothetical protein